MAANPRRTSVTRPDAGSLSLKTNCHFKKGATFHSPTSPSATQLETLALRPVPLPRRAQSNLDDVVDSHRRRIALTLSNIEKSLASVAPTPSSPKKFRDTSSPIPRGVLDHTLDTAFMKAEPETPRRVIRPRNRRSAHCHDSDSGLGTSIASSDEKPTQSASKTEKTTVKASAVTNSATARPVLEDTVSSLGARATNRVFEHTLKPLLAKPSFKVFHPLVLECPKKIQDRDIVCLRDLEKTLLLLAPERTKTAGLYLDFCLTTIRCIQATVEYLSDREQTRPRDLPYTSGYFIDLVDQIHKYAQQLADAREKEGEVAEMDVDPTDEIKLHGGIHINGRPAELVRVKKNGEAISIATGKPVGVIEEDTKGDMVRIKRSASQELEDEEEIMRSMARRKKNASPEELAPKRCREPGCNKEFKRPCDLTKHEKTHSRPWKCPVPTCKYHEYGWPTEKEMDRHHNDKHSSAPPMYECLYKPCPYKSKRESNCKQHMEKAHGWTYVRTKTNGKKPGEESISGSIHQATPQLQNMPTPSSDHSGGVATPPDSHYGRLYNNMDFPTYIPHDPGFDIIPQEIQLDYHTPPEHGTPSTDSGMDHSVGYPDIGNDFTLYEDIYSANVQIPTPVHNVYQKEMPQHYPAYTAAELCQPQSAPHLSPVGHSGAMLYTPTSLAEADECFDEHRSFSSLPANRAGDFVLFPGAGVSKALSHESMYATEMPPSMAGGYSQPNSQDFLHALNNMGWSQSYHGYLSQ